MANDGLSFPLAWENETVNLPEGEITNYFAEVFCGYFVIAPLDRSGLRWVANCVYHSPKPETPNRHEGTVDACKLWAEQKWETDIRSAISYSQAR